jgi:hypothetical protein
MAFVLIDFLQPGGGEAAIPDAGIRISVWFIVMFFLAIGAALLYLRMKEIEGGSTPGTPQKDDE